MKQKNLTSSVASAFLVTIIIGLVYASVQQSFRSGANDPQLQMARDISYDLRVRSQNAVEKWFGGDKIDISQSLSVFGALYNEKGEPVLSNGILNGKIPSLAKGVFDAAKDKGENVFTWQPQKGIRIAIVLKSVESSPYSFVAVGRSLSEVEKREENLRWMVVIAWLLCIGVIAVHSFISFMKAPGNLNK